MSRQFFGTDGVRGIANQYPMTAEWVLRLGRAVAYELHAKLKRRPRVLIGKDTRLSGYLFESALTAGLVSAGADVALLGPLPTPGIAFLTSSMRADAGLVISASHNPFEDNGIKIFARDGYKLPDAEELALEALLDSEALAQYRPTGTAIGRASRIHDATGRYAIFAKNAFPRQLTLEGYRLVLDCAHGAAYKVAPEVLRELGAEVITLGAEPDGANINEGCGALFPQHAAAAVRARGAWGGITLDGDADRCILIDERGEVVDGDQIMAILGRAMLSEGQLAQNTLVATVMSNLGLARAMESHGGRLVRVDVGDRYVVERMRAEGLNLGGEQSGHVILAEHATTGDGLVTALAVLAVAVRTRLPLSQLAAVMRRYPQTLVNLEVAERRPLETLPGVQRAVQAVERDLGDDGRVLLRYSGTQSLVRVMVEGPTQPKVEAAAQHIVESFKLALGRA